MTCIPPDFTYFIWTMVILNTILPDELCINYILLYIHITFSEFYINMYNYYWFKLNYDKKVNSDL